MKGVIVPTTQDTASGQHFGVEAGSMIFPVSDQEVVVRDIRVGSEVTFITDRETGHAALVSPPPVRGCERLRG